MAGSASLMWASVVTPSIFIEKINVNTSPNSTVTNTINAHENSLLVVCTTQSNDISVAANGAVTSSPTLTWTKQVKSGAAGTGNVEIWTAPFAAGGIITTTSTWAGGNVNARSGGSLYSILYNESTLAGATGNANSATNSTAPSVTLSTTTANSILICAACDWNGNSGASRVYRDSAIETLYYLDATFGTSYHFYKQATTVTSYTEGLTTPNMAWGMCVLEVRSI
jgi:hypothetical protein